MAYQKVCHFKMRYKMIYNSFIKNFEKKQKGIIGTELEFPLINLEKGEIEKEVAIGLLEYFLGDGFKTVETTTDGLPAFIENEAGDVLSFDNSYNNFEFSLSCGIDLCEQAKRFYGYFEKAQEYLKKHNYTLTGLGINPYKKYITQNHVDFPVYNMVDKFLHEFADETCHTYPDFPAYLSSVQTHLDVNVSELCRAVNLFASLEETRARLFSNSLSFDLSRGRYRDFLWERSAFPNTGKIEAPFSSVDDIVDTLKTRKMFNRIRDGKYECFAPITVLEYFKREDAEKKDISNYLSFKNIEITLRGTLEIRSDCAQPLYRAFAPPAFSLGILYNMERAERALKKNASPDEFVEIAIEGLKTRGKGEEIFLNGICEKNCPEKITLARLKTGEDIENIIEDYSKKDFA